MKKKTIWITSAAVAAVLVAGGAGLAVADPSDTDGPLTGSTLDTASRAALDAVGSGTVTDTETTDDPTAQAYEVEVTLDDDTDVDVALDSSFAVLWLDGPGPDGDPTAGSAGAAGTDGLAPLTDADRSAASAAALAAMTIGTVGTFTEVERSDDVDHAYEVEITLDNGHDIDVELDAAFTVLKVEGVPAA